MTPSCRARSGPPPACNLHSAVPVEHDERRLDLDLEDAVPEGF